MRNYVKANAKILLLCSVHVTAFVLLCAAAVLPYATMHIGYLSGSASLWEWNEISHIGPFQHIHYVMLSKERHSAVVVGASFAMLAIFNGLVTLLVAVAFITNKYTNWLVFLGSAGVTAFFCFCAWVVEIVLLEQVLDGLVLKKRNYALSSGFILFIILSFAYPVLALVTRYLRPPTKK